MTKILVLDGLFEGIFDIVGEICATVLSGVLSFKAIMITAGIMIVMFLGVVYGCSAQAQIREDVLGGGPVRSSTQKAKEATIVPMTLECYPHGTNTTVKYYFPEYHFWSSERGTYIQKKAFTKLDKGYEKMHGPYQIEGFDWNKPYIWYSNAINCSYVMAGS